MAGDDLVSLEVDEAEILRIVFAHMWPADSAGPDAATLGVVVYVDRALGGHDRSLLGAYRRGIAKLDTSASARFGAGFRSCSQAQQLALLTALSGTAPGSGEGQPTFFALLRRHLTEGLFADPAYGGNLDGGGWRSIGFPGVVSNHSHAENLGQPVPVPDTIPAMKDAVRPPPTNLAYRDKAGAALRGEAADVVVVGLGGVGALVAAWLSLAGLRVVALEAGSWRSVETSRPDELRNAYYARAGFGEKFNQEVPRWRETTATPTRDMPFSLGRMCNGVGGSLVHYGARLRRQHPHQFRMRSTLAEMGLLKGLDPSCTVADWPFDYAELEPFYEELEQLVGIAGSDAHPFIPRRRGLSMPPPRSFAAGDRFIAATRYRGMHPEPVPVGQNTVPFDDRPAMDYSPWGEGMGSPSRARWMPDDDLLPRAVATGNLGIRTRSRVLDILTGGDGVASGVRYVDETGATHQVKARAVVLSAYTFENIRLMFLSGDARRPDGLGNTSGQLGRHFMTKQFPSVYGAYPGAAFNRHTGPGAQGILVEDMLTPAFMAREQLAGGGTLSTENQLLPIQLAREPLPADMPAWGSDWKHHVVRWNERMALRIQTDTLPYDDNHIDIDPLRRDSSGYGLPVLRVTYQVKNHESRLYERMMQEAETLHREMGATRIWRGPAFTGIGSCHDLGGIRMGEDPARSVVSHDLAVHDTPGLYVMGGAVFPSCHAVNPTLTIWAVCRRAVNLLIERLS